MRQAGSISCFIGLTAIIAGGSRAALAADAAPGVPGADYNITLITDSAPDLTDIDSYLRSITSQYSTPQEKAIAIWRWSQRLRKQMTNPIERGQFVLDPIAMFNNYGYCNCGIVSGVNDALWLKMGWKAHYVQLGDHTVTECSWDSGRTWHMFDSSMSFYCFNDAGAVASVREINQNSRFYLQNFAPECATNPVSGPGDQNGWRCGSDGPVRYARTLANGWDSFKPKSDIEEVNLYAQWGARYVLNLRPGEYYTRYFNRLQDAGPGTFRPVGSAGDAGQKQRDVDQNKVIRANGEWRYAPNLLDLATRDLIYDESGVKWAADGVHGPGQVIFKVSAANVVTSAKLSLHGEGESVAVSADSGINWQKVELTNGNARCVEPLAGTTEYLVKVDLTGEQSLLRAIEIETITQLNRPALPGLRLGVNHVRLCLGPQVETIQFQPCVIGGKHAATAFSQTGIDVDPQPDFYKPTLRPALKDAACNVTWKIQTPTPITDVTYGGNVCVKAPGDRVTLLHSWDDKTYAADYQKTDDSLPWDLVVNTTIDAVPADARTAYLRYEFQTSQAPKQYFDPGIQTARMLIHHRPRVGGFAPILITYCWIEHRDSGDVERQHTELVTSAAHDYVINVGGFRDPTMKWVRMNLQGQGPVDDPHRAGYSDGQNAAPADPIHRQRFVWSNNLALHKPYTLEGATDPRNPDGGGDLTDGIIAPPDTYVSAKWMPTNVIFAKDVSPIITIDLGSAQTVAAVRVHAGQDGGFHLTYPNTIAVETSEDGKTFQPAGSAQFKQVFDPPADYLPWELDQSSLFDDLPAGGRLAYAYRIILPQPLSTRFVRVKCTARQGWGMMLSEVQVFDHVTIDDNVPPLVVLPPLAAGINDH